MKQVLLLVFFVIITLQSFSQLHYSSAGSSHSSFGHSAIHSTRSTGIKSKGHSFAHSSKGHSNSHFTTISKKSYSTGSHKTAAYGNHGSNSFGGSSMTSNSYGTTKPKKSGLSFTKSSATSKSNATPGAFGTH